MNDEVNITLEYKKKSFRKITYNKDLHFQAVGTKSMDLKQAIAIGSPIEPLLNMNKTWPIIIVHP